MSNEKKVFVNGEEQAPIKKVKIPAGVDWAKIVREKQEEKKE